MCSRLYRSTIDASGGGGSTTTYYRVTVLISVPASTTGSLGVTVSTFCTTFWNFLLP